ALLLRHSLGLENEALAVEAAVDSALTAGVRTADIALPGTTPAGSREAGAAVVNRLMSNH
ncbi:MAG: isocitrate/isopropylmalate family dehydrogenase, partial [Steroidobacteraceae bacterium]